MSFILWMAAWSAITLACFVYAGVGPNPVSKGLWVLAVVAGLLAHLAERLERS